MNLHKAHLRQHVVADLPATPDIIGNAATGALMHYRVSPAVSTFMIMGVFQRCNEWHMHVMRLCVQCLTTYAGAAYMHVAISEPTSQAFFSAVRRSQF